MPKSPGARATMLNPSSKTAEFCNADVSRGARGPYLRPKISLTDHLWYSTLYRNLVPEYSARQQISWHGYAVRGTRSRLDVLNSRSEGAETHSATRGPGSGCALFIHTTCVRCRQHKHTTLNVAANPRVVRGLDRDDLALVCVEGSATKRNRPQLQRRRVALHRQT